MSTSLHTQAIHNGDTIQCHTETQEALLLQRDRATRYVSRAPIEIWRDIGRKSPM